MPEAEPVNVSREIHTVYPLDGMYTAIIQGEDDAYMALCPELDIASQDGSIEGALSNLREAVDLFFQAADPREVRERQGGH